MAGPNFKALTQCSLHVLSPQYTNNYLKFTNKSLCIGLFKPLKCSDPLNKFVGSNPISSWKFKMALAANYLVYFYSVLTKFWDPQFLRSVKIKKMVFWSKPIFIFLSFSARQAQKPNRIEVGESSRANNQISNLQIKIIFWALIWILSVQIFFKPKSWNVFESFGFFFLVQLSSAFFSR